MIICDSLWRVHKAVWISQSSCIGQSRTQPKGRLQNWVNLPGIVMSGICPDCLSEARHSAVQLFCQHVLMTKQRVGISEGLANLDSSLEEFDCCVVFLLQTEAVTSCTPSLKQNPCLHVAYCDCYYLKYRIYNAGPEDVTKQHFCKILWRKLRLRGRL